MRRTSAVLFTVALVGGTVALAAGPGGAQTTSDDFDATGAAQTFTVPEGVCQVTIDALAGDGGDFISVGGDAIPGGSGGAALAGVPVTPGEQLTVIVGGVGGDVVYSGDPQNIFTPGDGGFGGGGEGGPGANNPEGEEFGSGAAGGGGASYVARGDDPLVVAGGGGGAGSIGGDVQPVPGGDGGGADGVNGTDGLEFAVDTAGDGGGGGTAAAPGAAGAGGGNLGNDNGAPGASLPDVIASGLPTGGAGGAGDGGNGGGGGGGGYNGGGGGGGTDIGVPGGGGGGGGAAFAEVGATGVTLTAGANGAGDGLVSISWDPSAQVCPVVVAPRFTG